MSFHFLTASDPGAPVLSGTNGSLCSVLDWALPQGGWTIHRSAGLARIYRSPNGRYLYVNHDVAVSGSQQWATVRGCEGGELNALVNPYPTVAQASDNISTWRVSNAASTAAKDYRILIKDDYVVFGAALAIASIPAASGFSMYFFGELATSFDPTYACAILVRGTNSLTVTLTNAAVASSFPSAALNETPATHIYWQRNVDGSKTSSRGRLNYSSEGTSVMGALPSAGIARAGYQNRVYRETVYVADRDSTSGLSGALSLPRRAALPHVWNPLHSGPGGLDASDSFQDSAYDPAAVFRAYPDVAPAFLILEETDTWRPY